MGASSEIVRLKYRHTLFVATLITITGLAWAIANATTWSGGLIFGLGALLLALFSIGVADPSSHGRLGPLYAALTCAGGDRMAGSGSSEVGSWRMWIG